MSRMFTNVEDLGLFQIWGSKVDMSKEKISVICLVYVFIIYGCITKHHKLDGL